MGRQAGGAVQDGMDDPRPHCRSRRRRSGDRLEDECLGVDAWSEGLVREGIAATLPTVGYLVAEMDDRWSGTRWCRRPATSPSSSGSPSTAHTAGHRCCRGPAGRGAGRRRAGPRPTGCCSRCARTTRAALAFYARQRVHRDRPTRPVLRRRSHRSGAAAAAHPRGRWLRGTRLRRVESLDREARRTRRPRRTAPPGRSRRAASGSSARSPGRGPAGVAPIMRKAPGTSASTREKSSEPAIGTGSSRYRSARGRRARRPPRTRPRPRCSRWSGTPSSNRNSTSTPCAAATPSSVRWIAAARRCSLASQ